MAFKEQAGLCCEKGKLVNFLLGRAIRIVRSRMGTGALLGAVSRAGYRER